MAVDFMPLRCLRAGSLMKFRMHAYAQARTALNIRVTGAGRDRKARLSGVMPPGESLRECRSGLHLRVFLPYCCVATSLHVDDVLFFRMKYSTRRAFDAALISMTGSSNFALRLRVQGSQWDR
jgi:hypothetical protein